MTAYKRCEYCERARSEGDWEGAFGCHRCKGTGAVRLRESWVCNACGGCLCPDADRMNGEAPHGLIDAKAVGGYDSPALSDCTTYTFSICETCLRAMFNGFKVPPKLKEYSLVNGDEYGTEQTYAEEASGLIRQNEVQEARDRVRADLESRDLCTELRDRQDPNAFCGRLGALLVVSDNFIWHLCEQHGHDAYSWNHATVAGYTWGDRCRIGMSYLEAFRKGHRPEPSNKHERAIFISTLFPLVAVLDTWNPAMDELRRLSNLNPAEGPEREYTWVSPRIATNFPPGHEAAFYANTWLAWGRREGYLNATAVAFLGENAEHLWSRP